MNELTMTQPEKKSNASEGEFMASLTPKQIVEELELQESRLKVFQDWKYDNWMKIYSSDPDQHKNLEASIVQFF